MAIEIPNEKQTKDIKDIVAGARDGLKDAFDKGSERAAHLKDVAMDRGRTALSTIERTMEERPLAVIGGVFAGGLILGMLMRRR
jgi:ElaB/YqjD/DUF883 family membrane-anchored ribosome-binding protein